MSLCHVFVDPDGRSARFHTPQEVTEPRWAFEVASVKASTSVDPARGGLFSPGARYSAAGIPLRTVIVAAYEIDPVRLSGGPDWLDSQGFDIDAKAEAGSIAAGALDRGRLHRLHLMLQALLRDRFKLTVDRETKQGPYTNSRWRRADSSSTR